MRVLLAAVLLGVGVGNAWAEDVVFTQVASYDFTVDGATDPFTNRTWSNRQTSTLEDDATLGTKAVVFKGANLSGKTSGYHTLDFSDLTGSSSQVKVEFDFYVNSSNCDRFALRDATIAEEPTKDAWVGTGAIFSIGAARVSGTNYFGYNGTSISGAEFGTAYHVSIIVDVVNKKVSYTLTKLSDNSVVATGSKINFSDANATACTRLDFHGSTNATMAAINNIVISEYTSASATTYSVIKYDKDGNELSSASGLAGVAGETSSASDADRATFYSADTNSKYVFDETDARNVTSMELTSTEATNVLKLYFDTYAKQTCTVKATDGTNDLGAIVSGTFYSDETSITLYWNKFVKINDVWYETEPDATNYFGYTFTASGEHTVAYTAASDVIYFAEWNSICERTYSNWEGEKASGGNSTILANKSGGSNAAATTATIAGGQVVDIYVCGYSCRGNATYSKDFYLTDGTTDTRIGRLTFTDVAFNTQVLRNVYIESNAKIKTIIASGNDHFAGDYIFVKNVSNVTAAITAAGWATLYTPYALDFSGVSGLTAYTATCSGSTVTLTEVSNVPANTGVVLKGAANTYNVPVIASSSTDKGHLLGSATDATAYNAYDGYTLYMLSLNGDNEAQFVPVTSGSIAAGKAFLKIAGGNSSQARSLSVVFADETTGVSEVRSKKSDVRNEYYNLSGQRISQPTKGLYIVNGKKIVIK